MMFDTGAIYAFLLMLDNGPTFLGHIEEKRQIELFGQSLGNGTIFINWTTGEIKHYELTAESHFERVA